MDVSVIIVNYNTLKMTSECIESIYAKTSGVEYEIILVDNGSTDGSKEYFEKDNRIKYIYSNENLGFGRANNLGAKYSNGKYLFLLNSDTILIENSIYVLFNFIENHTDYVACGAQLIYPNHTYQESEIKYPSLYRDIIEIIPAKIRRLFSLSNDTKYKINHVKTVQAINGADILIRKDIFFSLNGFDSDFFMYFEETDLFFRLKKAGYNICVVPLTELIHINGGSFGKINIKKTHLQYRSKLLFYRKHHNFLILFFAKSILTLSISLRCFTYKENFIKLYNCIWQ